MSMSIKKICHSLLNVVLTDDFKSSLKYSVENVYYEVYGMGYGRSVYDPSFLARIITYNPYEMEIQVFNCNDYYNSRSDNLKEKVNKTVDNIVSQEKYSSNVIMHIVYRDDMMEVQEYRDKNVSDKDVKLKIENTYLKTYQSILEEYVRNSEYI